ncbi:Transposase [Pseudovibrio sp. Tun.PSC04-5.I4]|nr:Transposase [Pseudovibrio sp. Tun.PSC04-5.I4]SDQ28845.1 Transposase [Pseudovibrio sp. Tun.PSC04-5.I4]SDQ73274.1 Transposase [Pseudovibrio sp. Tun.PSC04-5.I4]SDR27409.1 Transposase [Pseudovibrio sp. Tun.PSC04-5.I4]SDR47904.1 Transposase [Pseudovibrio sp. Tun.PSC04-5.I4]
MPLQTKVGQTLLYVPVGKKGCGGVVNLGKIVMIHNLKQQGLSVSAIARKAGLDRKTVSKYLHQGLEAPVYGPRQRDGRVLEEYKGYLLERLERFPGLSARRLLRELKTLGFKGGYSTVTEYLRLIRPAPPHAFERRFETAPGQQAQVDFAEFQVEFTSEPDVVRKVFLFSMVLSNSRFLWGRYCANQKLETVLRCHIAAFEVFGGATLEVLYDRMKTAVLGEEPDGTVLFNPALVALLDHYGAQPDACQPYRAKTKGKVERPFRYIRQDFFLGRTFRDLDDLNAQFTRWCKEIANARVHATTNRVVGEVFGEEQPALIPLPAHPYDAVLLVERRVTRDGMVSVGGNLYSVPDTVKKRMVEVQHHPQEVRIYENGQLIATHPVMEGKNQRRVDPCHRKAPPRATQRRRLAAEPTKHSGVNQRPLEFYEAVGQRLASTGGKP